MKRLLCMGLVAIVLVAVAFLAMDLHKSAAHEREIREWQVSTSVMDSLTRAASRYHLRNGHFPSSALPSEKVFAALTSPISYLEIADKYATHVSSHYVVDPYSSGDKVVEFTVGIVRGGVPSYFSDGLNYAVFVSPGPDRVMDFDLACFLHCETLQDVMDYIFKTGTPTITRTQTIASAKGDKIGACIRDTEGKLHIVTPWFVLSDDREAKDVIMSKSTK